MLWRYQVTWPNGGQSEKNALELKVEEINKAGGVLGKKLRLIAYDTRADVSEAMNVTNRLIHRDKVSAIIGPGQSSLAIVMTAVTEPGKVPFIATTATSPKVTVDDKTNRVRSYAFRTCFIDSFQGTVAARFSWRELKAKRAAVIYDAGSEYSSALGKFFVEEFNKLGGKITATESFRSNETDFRTLLNKVRQENPDLIFVPTLQKEAALLVKQARDLEIAAKFVGGDGWGNPDLLTLGGTAIEGSFFVSQASLEDPDLQPFVNKYREKYAQDPVLPNPVTAIDGLMAVVHSIKAANSSDPIKIAAQLARIKELPVLSGLLSIDPLTHNPLNKPAVIQEIKGGKIVLKAKMAGF